MLRFPIDIRPGQPIYEQIVFAVKKAVAQGVLAEGERFPSVRAVSVELGINPNTVQRAVAELVSHGFLEVHSGQGCFIALPKGRPRTDGLRILRPQVEALVVEASRLGLSESDVAGSLASEWRRLKREER